MNNKSFLFIFYIVIFSIGILFLFSFFLSKKYGKEGFQSNSWNDQTLQDFVNYENTANPRYVYDTSYVQLTATSDEVSSLTQNNKWTWDNSLYKLWANSVQGNPVSKYFPLSNADDIQSIYNQGAAKQLLALNTDEGRFLTQGVLLDNNSKGYLLPDGLGTFGFNSGLQPRNKDILRCDSDTLSLQRIRRGGYDGVFSISPDTATNIPPSHLPELIQGFSFVNGTCNPCVALKSQPDYSCPFVLGKQGISPLWQYLWGFNHDPIPD